jgi:hypothetical protein
MNHFSFSVYLVLAITLLPVMAHSEDGKKPSDAKIAKLLVGKWTMQRKLGAQEREFTHNYWFKKDDTFTAHSQALTANRQRIVDLGGSFVRHCITPVNVGRSRHFLGDYCRFWPPR